jgi:hypothetical protein
MNTDLSCYWRTELGWTHIAFAYAFYWNQSSANTRKDTYTLIAPIPQPLPSKRSPSPTTASLPCKYSFEIQYIWISWHRTALPMDLHSFLSRWQDRFIESDINVSLPIAHFCTSADLSCITWQITLPYIYIWPQVLDLKASRYCQ